MKFNKVLLIIPIIIVFSVISILIYTSNKERLNENTQFTKVGLGKDCNPKINNCDTGLECKSHGDANIYKCVMYLTVGKECGLSEAELCGEGLTCTNTKDTRTRCTTLSTDSAKECPVEPFQICKPK